MSAIQSRYRNGVTNLGVLCGFATNTKQGHLHLLTSGCTEMGWTVERTDGVRAAEYDFEPVLAVCQIVPPAEAQAQPNIRALHVMRMPRQMLPKRLIWFARDWPYNSTFTPFRERFHTHRFPEEFLATLTEEVAYPDWLMEIAEQDSIVEEILFAPAKGNHRHPPNRWVLTGQVVSGPLTTPAESPPNEYPTPYVPLKLWQPGDSHPLFLRIPITQRDSYPFLHTAQETQATVLFKARTQVLEHNGKRVLRSRRVFSVEEVLVPTPVDQEDSP